jgi:superfamily II DNA or RNA helicase
MNNIEKGYQYEIFINNYLNTLTNIKISYLWKDIPEYILFDYGFIKSYNDHRLQRKTNRSSTMQGYARNINKLEDIGTDIIYINDNDECIIVQCKNYTKPIKIEDLSGFFFIMCNHIDKVGEIYYTNKLSKKILLEYENNNRIKLIKKELINELNNTQNIIKPYEYQQNIITLANDYYKKNNSGIISLPCGTGKTLISCYIGIQFKIVIMITPLKQYAKQNIDRFKIYEQDRKALLIDSDGSRNIDEINEFINNNSESKILLSTTFKSCDIICNIIDKLENVFIIFDEFHNFSYNNIYDDENDIYKLINNSHIKKLYLSATPRIYELEDNNDIDVNEIFGDYIYKMSFNEAISNKYISDYDIYLPIFNNEELDEEINNLHIHQDYLLKLQFLIEAIKMHGNLKIIVYVLTHEEIDMFISEFNKLNEYYEYDVDINKITCDDNYNKRTKILDDFNNSTKMNILLSVHILDEAIDIPSCNSIYMTY